MDKQRKAFMEKVRQLIAGELPKIKACFRKANPYISDEEESLIFAALERRLDTVSVRSSFVFLCHKYLIEQSQSEKFEYRVIPEPDLIRLAFIADAAMAIMYIHNQIYDGKFGVTNSERISDNLAAGNLLKDALLDEYIHFFPAEYVPFIRRQMRNAFNHVDKGQMIDKHLGFQEFYKNEPYDNWVPHFRKENLCEVNHIIDELEEDCKNSRNIISIYFVRIFLINSSLLVALAKTVLRMMKVSTESLIAEKILKFSRLMGLWMQIVNDNSDFVLDKDLNNKKAEDVMSDLRNETISLPIILHLNKFFTGTKNHIKAYALGKEQFPKGLHNEVLSELIISGAMKQSQQIARNITHLAKGIFTVDGEININTKDLISLTEVADWNRYYYHIRKANDALRKGVPVKCEDYISEKTQQKRSLVYKGKQKKVMVI